METKEDAPRCDGSTPKKPAHSENIMVMNRIERKKIGAHGVRPLSGTLNANGR